MAVTMVPLVCPSCGGTSDVDSNREFAFCSYCGAKIMLHDDNHYRMTYTDEAQVARAKADREIRLKELEQEAIQFESHRKLGTYLLIAGAVMFFLGFAFSKIQALSILLLLGLGALIGGSVLIFKKPESKNQGNQQELTFMQAARTTRSSVSVSAGRPINKTVSLLLCLFAGYLGAHKFYEGKTVMGIVYLFTFGFFFIGVMIDFFVILSRPNPYYV